MERVGARGVRHDGAEDAERAIAPDEREQHERARAELALERRAERRGARWLEHRRQRLEELRLVAPPRGVARVALQHVDELGLSGREHLHAAQRHVVVLAEIDEARVTQRRHARGRDRLERGVRPFGRGERFVDARDEPQHVLRALEPRQIVQHRAASERAQSATRHRRAHDLEHHLAASAHDDGELGRHAHLLLEAAREVLDERLLLEDRHSAREGEPDERRAGRTKQRRRRGVRVLDDAVAIEYAVRDRCALEEVQVPTARLLDLLLRVTKLPVFRFELHLMKLELVQEAHVLGRRHAVERAQRVDQFTSTHALVFGAAAADR